MPLATLERRIPDLSEAIYKVGINEVHRATAVLKHLLEVGEYPTDHVKVGQLAEAGIIFRRATHTQLVLAEFLGLILILVAQVLVRARRRCVTAADVVVIGVVADHCPRGPLQSVVVIIPLLMGCRRGFVVVVWSATRLCSTAVVVQVYTKVVVMVVKNFNWMGNMGKENIGKGEENMGMGNMGKGEGNMGKGEGNMGMGINGIGRGGEGDMGMGEGNVKKRDMGMGEGNVKKRDMGMGEGMWRRGIWGWGRGMWRSWIWGGGRGI
ncbi:hypothetical protein EDB89DRAFT_1900647 [Lactarius sanguifluus]|nr:hypothetical protein EDB89DRAFT_1900647 [Lactarius sanguifluus]